LLRKLRENAGLITSRRPGAARKRIGWRKNEINIGTWNVLSLYRSGALKLLLKQLGKYKADIIALQEIRWNGEGILEKQDHTIFYSCEERLHFLGTGFVVKKKARHLIIGFKADSSRICTLRIKGKFFNYTIINAHAPTDVSEEEGKDEFYDVLEKTYEESPSHDVKIVIGDINAQAEEPYQPTNGKYSLHELTNDNGHRLIQMAASHSMVIGSTIFEHKDIHKATWVSQDISSEKQIYHVLIDSRHLYNLLNVRTFRGANVDSDHYLVIARIRSRISNVKKIRGEKMKRFRTSMLQNQEVADQYVSTIQERLVHQPYEEQGSIQTEWEKCKEIVCKVAEEVPGR
jgi:exonuclease III